MEHVLLRTEVDGGHQLGVHLLLQLVLQLLRGLHAVLRSTQDAADATLLILRELGQVLPLLQDGLDQARGGRDALLLAHPGTRR